MNKLNKILVLLTLIVVFSLSNVSGQERPMRIGLKFGYPQLAGLNLEYVTPALNKKLAADVDISYFSFDIGGGSFSYVDLYFGGNYYFFNEGKGLYGGLGFGRQSFSGEADVTEPSSNMKAKAEASVGLNSLYLKIGGKHGGLFYFRWDVGYGLGLNNAELKATATINGISVTESYDLPISGGGPMADIGFGFSF